MSLFHRGLKQRLRVVQSSVSGHTACKWWSFVWFLNLYSYNPCLRLENRCSRTVIKECLKIPACGHIYQHVLHSTVFTYTVLVWNVCRLASGTCNATNLGQAKVNFFSLKGFSAVPIKVNSLTPTFPVVLILVYTSIIADITICFSS